MSNKPINTPVPRGATHISGAGEFFMLPKEAAHEDGTWGFWDGEKWVTTEACYSAVSSLLELVPGHSAIVKKMAYEPACIYLAGPMSGIADHNFPAFNAAADALRAEGHQVVNPADHGQVLGAQWADYLRFDLIRLAKCTRIHMMKDWHTSKGATLEYLVARQLGMEITYAEGAEPSYASIDELISKAGTLNKIRELMGYIEAGEGTSVSLYQDDATKSYCISVGMSYETRGYYYGSTLAEAVQKATDAEVTPRG